MLAPTIMNTQKHTNTNTCAHVLKRTELKPTVRENRGKQDFTRVRLIAYSGIG